MSLNLLILREDRLLDGLLHKTQTEVNKIGERYFKIYSLDRVHNQIGITYEGLQMIKKNKEEIIDFSNRKA